MYTQHLRYPPLFDIPVTYGRKAVTADIFMNQIKNIEFYIHTSNPYQCTFVEHNVLYLQRAD